VTAADRTIAVSAREDRMSLKAFHVIFMSAAVLLAVGLGVLVRERRLPRLGARYAAPGARPAPTDPDRAAWQDLDAGRDPTNRAD
jgi:hypothetical protein